ncbi:MAG: class I SAM-dependent methyltransferase, partial [Candidatus Omnitrophica bacterium]|nr:class I SAM-dependent methyltransferase [Candidatus Omnitrophota bacterium]
EMPREGVVIDLGCGTGKSAIPIYNSGRRVIATDISMGMIRKAIKKSYDFGAGGITYFLSDVEDLPLNRDCFSAVMSSGVLHHLVDPCSVVKNIARLLKPGGCFYSHENHASLARPLFDLLMKANKLWNEEAGSHPLFRIKEIKDLLEVSGLCPDIRTSVFLPPHIFNLISYRLGKVILSVTDSLFGRRFLFRDFGGLLIIKGRKIK